MLHKIRYGWFFLLLLVLWSCKLDSKKEPAEMIYEVAVLRGPSVIAFAMDGERAGIERKENAGEGFGFARTDAGVVGERRGRCSGFTNDFGR